MMLYIDPGTGSMMFSILIGLAAALFFLVRALLLKVKVFISGKRAGIKEDSSYKDLVIYSEGEQYQSTFLPILEELERRSVEAWYLTSQKADPVCDMRFAHIHTQFIGEGMAAFAALNMLRAGVVLMTTPGLGVYQLHRSRGVAFYCHIVHMATDVATYRLFGLDFYDSVLLSGDYQGEAIRALEAQRSLPAKELVTVGCPYLDAAAISLAAKQVKQSSEYTVLVAPSWGSSGLLALYGGKLLDPLVRSGYHVIIRPHPQSRKSEKAMLAALEAQYGAKDGVEWDYNRDNSESLSRSDILISDFSGIVFDYAFLRDRPVLYAVGDIDLKPYDAYDLCYPSKVGLPGKDIGLEALWQFRCLPKLGVPLLPDDFAHIKEKIDSIKDSPSLLQGRREARDAAWMHRGEGAACTVDYLVKKLATLKAKTA